MKQLIKRIQDNLTPDLLKPEYRGHHNRYYGHCYVASEALYHMTHKTLTPKHNKDHNNITHWWLEDNQGNIIDPTHQQYTEEGHTPPYNNARTGAFLTKQPSKRTQILMERVNETSNH